MKVLIVDDGLVRESRVIKGLAKDYRFLNILESKDIILESAKISDCFDLTKEYISSGGNSDNQVLILTEPKTAIVSSDDIHKVVYSQDGSYSEIKDLIKKDFSFDLAIEKIERINPDVILLDLGIAAWAPDEIIAKYSRLYEEKSSHPIVFSNSEYIDMASPHRSGLMDEYRKEHYLHNAGGVILGHYLNNKRIPFSFWTSDFGHGKPNLVIASTLDVLTTEDLGSFVNNVSARMNEVNNNLRKMREKIISNDSGNILAYGKTIFDFKDGALTGRLSNDGVIKLEQAIKIASMYKNR